MDLKCVHYNIIRLDAIQIRNIMIQINIDFIVLLSSLTSDPTPPNKHFCQNVGNQYCKKQCKLAEITIKLDPETRIEIVITFQQSME